MSTEPVWVGEVLSFWFQELGGVQWFAKSRLLDEQIRDRFQALHEQVAGCEGCDVTSPEAILAAVIVLDQFSRNLFRGTPRAFAADALARRLARQAIAQGLDAAMKSDERLFLYLPFEHSEDRADQVLSVDLIGRLGREDWTHYAEAHKAIIERFGRFPHRNSTLGRSSTPEELAFLEEPGSAF